MVTTLNQIHAVFPTGRSINAGPVGGMYSATRNACTEKVIFFVEDMGLFVSDKHQFLGACVDWKVNYPIRGTGMIEIKYPYGRKEDE